MACFAMPSFSCIGWAPVNKSLGKSSSSRAACRRVCGCTSGAGERADYELNTCAN